MPAVRVILHEGQEKLYHEAQASMHTPDRTLRITRNQDSIAEFGSVPITRYRVKQAPAAAQRPRIAPSVVASYTHHRSGFI